MDFTFKLTTNGRAAMAACLDLGAKPTISRVAFGAGKIDPDAEFADQHELLQYVADGTIADRYHQKDHFYFTIQYSNLLHPKVKTFYLSEFMVYIIDPDTGEETDLLYGTLGDYRQPVPQYHDGIPPATWHLPLVIVVSGESQISVSAPPGLVTYDELDEVVKRRVQQALAAGIGASVEVVDLTIPAISWTQNTALGRYQYCADVQNNAVKTDHLPDVILSVASLDAATDAGLAPTVDIPRDGVLRFYAQAIPAVDLTASCRLWTSGDSSDIEFTDIPVASANMIGGVKVRPGSGLSIDASGNLALDAASSADVTALFNGSKS